MRSESYYNETKLVNEKRTHDHFFKLLLIGLYFYSVGGCGLLVFIWSKVHLIWNWEIGWVQVDGGSFGQKYLVQRDEDIIKRNTNN